MHEHAMLRTMSKQDTNQHEENAKGHNTGENLCRKSKFIDGVA